MLETVNDAKYIGLNISSNFSWNKYVNQITTTASKTLNFIYKT